MLRAAALLTAALAVAAGLVAGAAPATAAESRGTVAQRQVSVATGHDVSYPQCGRALPSRGDIAVVGVNGGTGTTTNPCLATQLTWGDAPAADGAPRLADVYVNTANPGHLAEWWPRSDLTRTGLPVANPAGACVGAEDAACAYVYGYSIATDDALRRGVTRPGDRMWWLDVETMNSWSWSRAANLSVLEGMTAALRSVGASVGVYSTSRQWSLIVGSAAPSSALSGAPSWVAGAVTRGGAEAQCAAAPFTPGGRVAMVQWVESDLDHDVSCFEGVSGTAPEVGGDPAVGGLLTARTGTWGPGGVRLALQWLRDGAPIAGATGAAYSPVPEDLGTSLTLRVTGTRTGAPTLVLTSAGTTATVPVVTEEDVAAAPTGTPAPVLPAPTVLPTPSEG